MLTKLCKKCGEKMLGTPHATNPTKILWCHTHLKACAKVKPIR